MTLKELTACGAEVAVRHDGDRVWFCSLREQAKFVQVDVFAENGPLFQIEPITERDREMADWTTG